MGNIKSIRNYDILNVDGHFKNIYDFEDQLEDLEL